MTRKLPAVLLWLACSVFAVAQPVETVLHSFGLRARGANPYAGLIRDSGGNLYGTTQRGGAYNAGSVFKISTTGQQTVLYSFTGGADGASPYAGVTLDTIGNLYGTASAGGGSNAGVVYKLDTGGNESVLYSFTGGSDGGTPQGGVTLDSAGNLYGTTSAGGGSSSGVIYKLDPSNNQSVLHSFTFGADGAGPVCDLALDASGNLYGTAPRGGGSFQGVVYKLDTSDNMTVLYTFSGGNDGGSPYAGVTLDAAGNLYGTTVTGGTSGGGVVFKLDTSGNESVLYSFTGGSDGGQPYSGVVLDKAGNLYGTTYDGGSAGHGTLYKVAPGGGETVLHSFDDGADGGNPYGTPVRDTAGNLYGTAFGGGATAGGIYGYGVVYKLRPTLKLSILFAFPGPPDGVQASGLIRDSSGNLYGTTSTGGAFNAGVIYKLDPSGNETVLHSFNGGTGGNGPLGGVTLDPTGNLYGTTYNGGTHKAGVVFKLDPTGHETVLHNFTGGKDGGFPYAGVTLDAAGNLYGTASMGGAKGDGVVYKIDTTGTETVLHAFNGKTGKRPYAGVILDSSGILYGTTLGGGAHSQGEIYKLDTLGNLTVLYSFTGFTDGGAPYSGVVFDSKGDLCGTTYQGGASGQGEVYKLVHLAKRYKLFVLYSFTDGMDGGYPTSGVTLDASGNLYGTASLGGASNAGVVYQVAGSTESVLYSFTGGMDGGSPANGLILDMLGNLYGTTAGGGLAGDGVVFQLTP